MAELDPDFWPKALTKVVAHEALSRDEAAEAMRQVMAGEASSGHLGGLLMALRTKGETVDEVEGFARMMLAFAQPVETGGPLVDTCGTGGDPRGGVHNSLGAVSESPVGE